MVVGVFGGFARFLGGLVAVAVWFLWLCVLGCFVRILSATLVALGVFWFLSCVD